MYRYNKYQYQYPPLARASSSSTTSSSFSGSTSSSSSLSPSSSSSSTAGHSHSDNSRGKDNNENNNKNNNNEYSIMSSSSSSSMIWPLNSSPVNAFLQSKANNKIRKKNKKDHGCKHSDRDSDSGSSDGEYSIDVDDKRLYSSKTYNKLYGDDGDDDDDDVDEFGNDDVDFLYQQLQKQIRHGTGVPMARKKSIQKTRHAATRHNNDNNANNDESPFGTNDDISVATTNSNNNNHTTKTRRRSNNKANYPHHHPHHHHHHPHHHNHSSSTFTNQNFPSTFFNYTASSTMLIGCFVLLLLFFFCHILSTIVIPSEKNLLDRIRQSNNNDNNKHFHNLQQMQNSAPLSSSSINLLMVPWSNVSVSYNNDSVSKSNETVLYDDDDDDGQLFRKDIDDGILDVDDVDGSFPSPSKQQVITLSTLKQTFPECFNFEKLSLTKIGRYVKRTKTNKKDKKRYNKYSNNNTTTTTTTTNASSSSPSSFQYDHETCFLMKRRYNCAYPNADDTIIPTTTTTTRGSNSSSPSTGMNKDNIGRRRRLSNQKKMHSHGVASDYKLVLREKTVDKQAAKKKKIINKQDQGRQKQQSASPFCDLPAFIEAAGGPKGIAQILLMERELRHHHSNEGQQQQQQTQGGERQQLSSSYQSSNNENESHQQKEQQLQQMQLHDQQRKSNNDDDNFSDSDKMMHIAIQGNSFLRQAFESMVCGFQKQLTNLTIIQGGPSVSIDAIRARKGRRNSIDELEDSIIHWVTLEEAKNGGCHGDIINTENRTKKEIKVAEFNEATKYYRRGISVPPSLLNCNDNIAMAEFGHKIRFYYIFRPHILYHPTTLDHIFTQRLGFPVGTTAATAGAAIDTEEEKNKVNYDEEDGDDATAANTTATTTSLINYLLSHRNLRHNLDKAQIYDDDQNEDDTNYIDDDDVVVVIDNVDNLNQGIYDKDGNDDEEKEEQRRTISSGTKETARKVNTNMDFLFWNFGSGKPAFPYYPNVNTEEDTKRTKTKTATFPSNKIFGLDDIHDRLIDIQKRDIGYYFGADNPWIQSVPDIHPCMPGIPDDQVNWMLYILLQKLS